MKIYISGPISGLPYEAVRARFERDKRDLAAADFEPVSPLENGLPPDAPWEEHMKRDLAILARAMAYTSKQAGKSQKDVELRSIQPSPYRR